MFMLGERGGGNDSMGEIMKEETIVSWITHRTIDLLYWNKKLH